MKYKSLLTVAVVAAATLVSSLSAVAQTTLVNWEGNYFTGATTDLNMIRNPVALTTGTLVPFSATTEISPTSSGRYAGTSSRFFGTTLLQTADGSGGGTAQTRIVYNGGQNRIHVNSQVGAPTNHANIQGMFAWKKDDFLNGGDTLAAISLTSLNTFSVNVPNARGNSTIRFAIQNAGTWYLSESSLTGNRFGTALGTFVLDDLASSKWGEWDPNQTTTGLNPAPTSFDTLASQLTDVTAVGFWFNADYTSSNAAILGFDAFSVTAIPEPGSVAFIGIAGAILLVSYKRFR